MLATEGRNLSSFHALRVELQQSNSRISAKNNHVISPIRLQIQVRCVGRVKMLFFGRNQPFVM